MFTPSGPMYDPDAVQHMRDELTWVGFDELHTPEEVDDAIQNTDGTVLVMINSVCGCAAGSARPGVGLALQHKTIPDRLVTVFAGQEREATARVREYLNGFPPSSPSMALFRDGKVVQMIERHHIEGRYPDEIAAGLTKIFDDHCARTGPSISPEKYEQLVHAKTCGSKVPRVGD